MASRAYAKALQIEDPEAAPKLALLRELYELPAPAPVVATVAAASRVASPVPVPSSAPAAVASTPAPPAASAVAAAPSAVVAPHPAASAASTPAPTPAATPTPGADESRAVSSAVRDWAAAWSRKDMNGYFAAYAPGFKGNEASAAAWQASRRQRITGKSRISVDISGLQVQVQKGVAKVSFHQAYVADLLRVTSQKTLELEQHNGKWLIRKESTG